VGIALALALVFLVSNLALQYGAARLPANLTAVVMLTEVLFASISSLAFGNGVLSARLLLGGALILAGAVLAAFGRPAPDRVSSATIERLSSRSTRTP
ncbi:MAG: hypothetical protein ACREXI_04365, partial [Caldimonas sp.]